MKRGMLAVILLFVICSVVGAQDVMIGAEPVAVAPQLEVRPVEKEQPRKVTAVYGISADDYFGSCLHYGVVY